MVVILPFAEWVRLVSFLGVHERDPDFGPLVRKLEAAIMKQVYQEEPPKP